MSCPWSDRTTTSWGSVDRIFLNLTIPRDEMPEVPTEPIETPAHEHIEPTTFGIEDKRVECGTTVLCPPTHPGQRIP